MKIGTKFNIGDTAYFMYNNKVSVGSITGIRIKIIESDDNIYIRYYVLSNCSEHDILECNVFSSKEELLNSL